VVLTDRALTPIESAYLPAIKALCEKNNAALALMKLPMADSQSPIEISSQVLALGIPIVAASLESMFGDIPAERVKENYSNYIHFNANGARRSAETYGPALQALLQRTGG
jgi:lysophospholipase L1-like esterase